MEGKLQMSCIFAFFLIDVISVFLLLFFLGERRGVLFFVGAGVTFLWLLR